MDENKTSKDFAGKAGFIWWVGVVEDRQDPLKLGRLRVRCVGYHADNKMELSTDMLPWAMPMLPTNNSNPYPAKEGDMVFGFFTDGENAQEPVVMGTFPGIPLKAANAQEAFSDPRLADELVNAPRSPEMKEYATDGTGIVITEKPEALPYPLFLDEPSTSRIARNDSDTITETFIQERIDNVVTEVKTYNKEEELSTWDEPKTLYDAVYPYNNVNETESGHLIEYDDTPGAERIHIAHRNGSFTEWYPDGDKVEKITKDNYRIVMKDDHLYVMGSVKITVQGDAEVYVQKNMYARVDENLTALVKGNLDATINGDVGLQVDGNYDLNVTGDIVFNGKTINMNHGTKGAARIGDTADTGDQGGGGHFDTNPAGTNVIETGSGTVFIGD